MKENDLKAQLAKLNDKSSLRELQEYVKNMVVARNFDMDKDLSRKMLMMTEEVGELAQAIRKHERMSIDMNADYNADLPKEIADVLIILLSLANMCNIDLAEAFLEKEAINQDRVWGQP